MPKMVKVGAPAGDAFTSWVEAGPSSLDLDALARGLDTSRTPARGALLPLTDDGLVRVVPRSGITLPGVPDVECSLGEHVEIVETLSARDSMTERGE